MRVATRPFRLVAGARLSFSTRKPKARATVFRDANRKRKQTERRTHFTRSSIYVFTQALAGPECAAQIDEAARSAQRSLGIPAIFFVSKSPAGRRALRSTLPKSQTDSIWMGGGVAGVAMSRSCKREVACNWLGKVRPRMRSAQRGQWSRTNILAHDCRFQL